jgi:hypothetical protein
LLLFHISHFTWAFVFQKDEKKLKNWLSFQALFYWITGSTQALQEGSKFLWAWDSWSSLLKVPAYQEGEGNPALMGWTQPAGGRGVTISPADPVPWAPHQLSKLWIIQPAAQYAVQQPMSEPGSRPLSCSPEPHSLRGWGHLPIFIPDVFSSAIRHGAVGRVCRVSTHVAHGPSTVPVIVTESQQLRRPYGKNCDLECWWLKLCFKFFYFFSIRFILVSSKHLPDRFPRSSFLKVLFSIQFSLCYKFLKVSPCRNYFCWKSRWPLLLMRHWILNLHYKTFPFIYFGKIQAYPPNYYWISKHWQQSGHPTKKTFSSPSIIIILQSMRSLWLTFFLHSLRIVRYKILRLRVEKNHFIFIFNLHAKKYTFEA